MIPFKAKKVLYFPGCYTQFKLKNIRNNYEKILVDMDIEYVKLADIMVCCGIEALEAGYKGDMLKLMETNLRIIKNQKITEIVTNCASCHRAFKEYYHIKSKHILELVYDNLDQFKRKSNAEVTYFHSSDLRKSGIDSEPIEILEHLGFKVKTIDVASCGAEGGLSRNFPEVADKISKLIFEKMENKILITSDPKCYLQLKKNAPKDIKVLEISEVLV